MDMQLDMQSSLADEGKSGNICVFLVDDHPIVRGGLSLAVHEEPGMQIIGEAGDGREAVESIRNLRPDVVLMDIELPSLSGIEVTKQILETNPEVAVLIFSAFGWDDLFLQAFKAGAVGYAMKGIRIKDLLDAIRTVRFKEISIIPLFWSELVESSQRRS